MCCFFSRKQTDFKDKYIYWDTNCYRLLGRIANIKGVVWLDSFLKKLKSIENQKGIEVKVSYLVLCEMYAHLNDPITSNSYLECKHGLYAALYHTNFNLVNLLPNTDNELVKFVTGNIPIADTHRANSLYTSILQIHNQGFGDAFIKQNSHVIQIAINYLNAIKTDWQNSFVNHYIKKHDPSYTGNWQLFASNKVKRAILLRELRRAKSNGLIFEDFARGVYAYLNNNIAGIVFPPLNQNLLNSIIQRFKPLFSLQYRIIELMTQSGYNLNNYLNDITDYLIIANLEPGKSIFVSNETKHLIPNLHSQGFKDEVWTFDKYCSTLNVSYK